MENYDLNSKEAIGQGKQGQVWAIKNKQDGELYALKQIFIKDKRSREQAESEIKLLSSFSHKNILKYKESFVYENCLCIVTQFAKGGTLTDLIKTFKDNK